MRQQPPNRAAQRHAPMSAEEKRMWSRPQFFYFLAAGIVFLILHLYFVLAWDTLYAPYPWPGYAPGVSPPVFTSSPSSQLVAYAVLFAIPLGLTLLPAGRRPWMGLAMWAGVMAAIVLVWIATPQLRNNSNMWPISLVFLSFKTGVPMLIGRTIGLLYWRIRIGQKLEPWLVAAAVAALVIVGWLYR